MWRLLKNDSIKKYEAIIEEFSRQMGIFVRNVLYRLVGCSGIGHISDTWMW